MSAWICRSLTARPRYKLFHLVLESHDGRAQVPIPKRSTSPRVTSTAAEGDSLKVLDPEWPIREADMHPCGNDAVFCLAISANYLIRISHFRKNPPCARGLVFV